MSSADLVRVTFEDLQGTTPVRTDFDRNITTYDLEEKIARAIQKKISKIAIKMSGPYMSTVLEISRTKKLSDYAGAFVKNTDGMDSITLVVLYDLRAGSSSKKTKRKTKRKRTIRKRRTYKRK
jgi:hypothetical protein